MSSRERGHATLLPSGPGWTSCGGGVATFSTLGEAFVCVEVGSGCWTTPGVMGSSAWWAVTTGVAIRVIFFSVGGGCTTSGVMRSSVQWAVATGVAMKGSSVFCSAAFGVVCACIGAGRFRRLLLGVSSKSLRFRRVTLHCLRFLGFEGEPVTASFRIAANTRAHTPVASDLSPRNFGIIQIFRIIGLRQLTTLYRNAGLMVCG